MRLDMTVTDGNSDGVTSATSTATATTASISVTGSLTATVSSSGLVSVVRQMSQQSQVVPALSQSDIQNSVWLAEMERGFDTLVDTIYPYINDIKGAIVLKK